MIPKSALNKSERLVSALYLVSGFFADNEPLKWRLRSLGSDLIAKAVSGNGPQIKTVISEIVSLLKVAKNAGLISEMNESVIEAEFESLRDMVEPAYLFDHLLKSPEERRPEEQKDKIEYKRQPSELPAPKQKTSKGLSPVSEKKNGRQEVILGIIRKRGEIMIKDVVPMISGCSEKTIQRELLSMVKAGILKKVGEKRWSRYSLA